MRELHESLLKHFDAIAALGEYHPPTGRIETLNNNWETLVRRGRGYRDLTSLMCPAAVYDRSPNPPQH